jgi:monoamine oxidase
MSPRPGGEWVARRQTPILALCRQFGIETFRTYTKGDTTFYDGQGRPHRYGSPVPPIGAGPRVEVLAAIAELTEMCNKVNLKEPHKTPNALDGIR